MRGLEIIELTAFEFVGKSMNNTSSKVQCGTVLGLWPLGC